MKTGGEPAPICRYMRAGGSPSHTKRIYHKFCRWVMWVDPGHKLLILTHWVECRHPLHCLLCLQKRGQASLSAVLADIDTVKAATAARIKAKRMVREDVLIWVLLVINLRVLGKTRTPCFYIALGPDHPLQVSNRLQSANAMPVDCHLTSTIPGPCRGSSTLLHGDKVPSFKPYTITGTSSHTNAFKILQTVTREFFDARCLRIASCGCTS